MRVSLVTLGVGAVLLVSACGGDDDKGYGDPITITSEQKSEISGLVSEAASVASVASTTPCDGEDLAKMTGLYASMTLLLDAKLTAQNTRLAPQVLEALQRMGTRSAGKLPEGGTCVPGSGNVTFDDYQFEGGTMDGTISFGGGKFTTDLTVTVSQDASSVAMKMKGSLTVSDTAIKGNLSLSASVAASGATVTAEFASNFDLHLTNNCATGGQIEVHASGEATTSGSHATYDLWAKAVFGPACGDVTIY
jgi:hypothetical protein